MTKEKLCDLYIKIMTELYAKALPKADFNKILKNPKKHDFNDYYLPRETFEEIYLRNIKGKRLNKQELMSMGMSVYLEASPTSALPPSKHKVGYTDKEVDAILRRWKVPIKAFNKHLRGVTCGVDETTGENLIYTCDIELALRLIVENRDATLSEWD